VSAELISELKVPRRHAWRARAVSSLGPSTAFVALVWAIAQPYRITLLHPHGQSFWWLVVEPPLLVLLVGVVFHLLVVPGLLEDLEAADDASR
jgi:membrane protein YdbS with pleckstrin-like domain